jgi:Tfx family DNA-binding protein
LGNIVVSVNLNIKIVKRARICSRGGPGTGIGFRGRRGDPAPGGGEGIRLRGGRLSKSVKSEGKNYFIMKDSLLTERQKEVLRYRKKGLTQQQIADIIGTSKANVCTIEKAALENIRRSKETLEFLYTLDATHLTTIKAGTDLLDAAKSIYSESENLGIKVKSDTISLINQMRDSNPERFKARHIREDVEVYINDDGDLYFG